MSKIKESLSRLREKHHQKGFWGVKKTYEKRKIVVRENFGAKKEDKRFERIDVKNSL